MITDPVFYLYAVTAVLMIGVAKGGFTGLGMGATLILALVVPPLTAVAILLPVLVVMDLLSLWAWRGVRDMAVLRTMLPAALAGIGVAALTARRIDPDALRLVLGLIVSAFIVQQAAGALRRSVRRAPPRWFGALMGFVSGFTSFVANAGTPPFQVYVLPQNLDSRVYVGTKVVFFAGINFVKVAVFASLGQLGTANLATSAVLMPLAPLGIWLGGWLVRRLSKRAFYAVIYSILSVAALKLLWDGLRGLL